MEPFFSGSTIGRTNASLTWKISSRRRRADFRPPSGLSIAIGVPRPNDSIVLVMVVVLGAMRPPNPPRLLYHKRRPVVNILTCSSPYDTAADGAAPASATGEERPRPRGVSSRGCSDKCSSTTAASRSGTRGLATPPAAGTRSSAATRPCSTTSSRPG